MNEQDHHRCSAAQLGMRLGGLMWRTGERERDLQSAYQLPCSGYPEDSQGVSVVVGACDETMNGVKAV